MNRVRHVGFKPTADSSKRPVPKGEGMSLPELILIGVGGIIGAGFFLGSGVPIRSAGPSVLVALLFGGVITAQVLGALNSVTLDDPVEGAFKVYADRYLGRFIGYLQGWTYYLTSILTISSEAVASAIFVRVWVPSLPLWLLSSTFAAIVLAINAFGVKDFGLLESLMSVVKIAALVGFILFGVMFVFGLHPYTMSATVGLTANAYGFLPNGFSGLFQSMLIVIFAYAGIGVFSTAAIQLKRPNQLDAGAIATILILTILYILSVGILLFILPWNHVSMTASPFVQALQFVHRPLLADILNAVILIAAFSVMAGAVFAANQIFTSLGRSGEAPRFATKVSPHRHIPYGALIFTGIGLALFIGLSYILPSSVYNFLVSASSFFTFFNWFIMLATFLSWRKHKSDARISRLAFGQPISTVITMIAIVVLAGSALLGKDQRYGFYACLVVTAIVAFGYRFTRKYRASPDASDPKSIKEE